MATPTKSEIIAYIRQAAVARGIDPNIAVRVARSEGLSANPSEGWQSRVVKGGKRETSYGPFQLLVGGGLGDNFRRQTGLDPREPETVYAQIDFSLDYAAQNGWGSWYGARRVGVSDRAGLANAAPIGVQATVQPATFQPQPYDQAATESLLSAFGVTPQQAIAGTDRFSDPALGFAQTAGTSPAINAATAEANGVLPPTEAPYSMQQRFADVAGPYDGPSLWRQMAEQSLADAQANPPRPGDYFSLPDLQTLQPDFPIGGRPSYATNDLPPIQSVKEADARNYNNDTGLPYRPPGAPSQFSAPYYRMNTSGGYGSGVYANSVPMPRLRPSPSAVASTSPRRVATQTITPSPSDRYTDDVIAATQGAPSTSTAYVDPFNTRASGKDQSRMPEYSRPSSPGGGMWGIGSAAAAPAPAPQVPKWSPTPLNAAQFNERFETPATDAANRYSALTQSDIPTVNDLAGLGYAIPGAIPVAPAAPPATPKTPVTPAAPATQRRVRPPARAMPRIPKVTRQQAQKLAQRVMQTPSVVSQIFGGTQPTLAGPGTSPQNTYTAPVSGTPYDVTPGPHGSYVVSNSGTIMSPSEYIASMGGGGPRYW